MQKITCEEFLLSFNNSVDLKKNYLNKNGNYFLSHGRLTSDQISELKEKSGLIHIGQKYHNHVVDNYFYSAPEIKDTVEA